MPRNVFVAVTFARRRTDFYFSQRLRQQKNLPDMFSFRACYTRQRSVQLVSQQNYETSCKKNCLCSSTFKLYIRFPPPPTHLSLGSQVHSHSAPNWTDRMRILSFFCLFLCFLRCCCFWKINRKTLSAASSVRFILTISHVDVQSHSSDVKITWTHPCKYWL